MAIHIVLAEPRKTVYRLPEEQRRAILSQAQTDLGRTTDLASMREIEKQRQEFIQMHGDPFGLDTSS
ncbi:hypothetical protein DEE44_11460 [Ralstonia pickettii]|jgi:hypothetical protein|uniref:Uncharacterized protein n=2 Tax=Ralstonia pickettii TaxID=329 RepID=A0ABN9I0T5_RALPI|nr:hypothetical protein [Ralstonia pickettii]MBA9882654.1 hypothetical protein [Ralstonia pickettii]MBA9892770.1 hypothetical protein [Ralstonia pickettii]MBA9924533.1 hypothetical protein [Ralstonia pickettii]MBA9963898.1 hypothetical protein [Ralstonia pickettii]MBB0093088.1 hypothetical protein [Ralstonia pickettii]